VDVEGDVIAFTFAPAHKSLRTQLEGKRAWIESLAQSLTGRKMTVEVKEGVAAPAASRTPDAGPKAAPVDADRQAGLRARARAEPAVQNVLDVFGGDIEDVEEIQ